MISPRKVSAAVVVAVAAGLLASGCANTVSDAATVKFPGAKDVETQHVSREEFQRELSDLVSNKSIRPLLSQNFAVGDSEDATDAKLTATWLTQAIRQSVVDAQFASQHLEVSPAYTTQATDNVKKQYTEAAFNAFPKSLRDKLVKGDARLIAVLQSCPSDRLISHILVHTEAEANAALAQIRAGKTFTEVAQKTSIDGSAPSGGVLGCLSPNQFDPAFQAAAEKATLDSVTAPVKTQFGYHLILARHWDPALASNQQIAQTVQDAGLAALNERLQKLDVWVDPRYGTWGAHDTQNGKAYFVDPPAVPAPRDQREKG